MKDRATKIGLWLISAILIGIMAMGFIAYSCEKTETASALEIEEQNVVRMVYRPYNMILGNINGGYVTPTQTMETFEEWSIEYNMVTGATTIAKITKSNTSNKIVTGSNTYITPGQTVPFYGQYNKYTQSAQGEPFNILFTISPTTFGLSNFAITNTTTRTTYSSAGNIGYETGIYLVGYNEDGDELEYKILNIAMQRMQGGVTAGQYWSVYSQVLGYYINMQYVQTNANVNIDAIYNTGYNSGYNKATEDLYDTRYNAGYQNGYIQGVAESNEYSFVGLLNAVFYSPLKAFVSMLNFEILGVNILTFVTALLTLAVVTTLIKVVL